MALRNILKSGDERLRKKAREVTEFNERLWTLLDDMAETMKQSDGVGLAAPQVGVLRRVVTIDVGDGLHELINPVILQKAGDQYGAEGCLSVPGEWGMVHRPKTVTVRAMDRNGKAYELSGEDYLAVAICHESDHLEGVLFTDLTDHMLTEEELEQL